MGDTLVVGEAMEPAAVAKKAAQTITTKTRKDEDAAETVRPVEATANYTNAPSDTKQTKEVAAAKTMKAIGEAVKAIEEAMGAKDKSTNTTISNETKNLGDIVYAAELNSGIEAMGLANFAMALITARNFKNKNVKLEQIKVENEASSQIEKPTLAIAIIKKNLSKTQIDPD